MRHAHATRAFTLIELLVVVGIVALLLAVVLVASSGALSSSKRSATQRLLTSVGSALEQFNADHGYYPPVLTFDTGGPRPFALTTAESAADAYDQGGRLDRDNYNSVLSLAAYLVGVGDLNGDRVTTYAPGPNLDDGVDGVGFRSPGDDRSWGGAAQRPAPNATAGIPPQTGRVFGPYIDVAANNAARPGKSSDFQGLTSSPQPEDLRAMSILVDRWDTPIRYYRHWPTRDRQSRESTLADVPAELLSREAAEAYAASNDNAVSVDSALLTAPYALLSAGEDAFFGHSRQEGLGSAPTFLRARDLEGLPNAANGQQPGKQGLLDRIADNVRYVP